MAESGPQRGAASATWPHSLRGVAFDMDGLMFDTEPLYFETGTELLRRRGKHFNESLQREMMGRPGREAIRVMIEFAELSDTCEDLLAESDELFLQIVAGKLVAMPGLSELVPWLEERDIPFGVATSSRRHIAEMILGDMQLLDRIQFLLTGDDVVNGKPHPEIYERASQNLQIEAHQMLVLEDSGIGIRAAKASGACAIAVPGDHSREHDFSPAWAVAEGLGDPLIRSLLEQCT